MVASKPRAASKQKKRPIGSSKLVTEAPFREQIFDRKDIEEHFANETNVALQFADCSVGLTIRHLPVLLTIGVPLCVLLIALASPWILVIPFLSLQIVAIFLCLDEPQGASLLLHVMTLLAVSLSVFLFGSLVFLSWYHFFFYLLCIGVFVGLNVLVHLTLDSVVEDDKETAVTLEVTLMKIFPCIGGALFSWTFYSAIPVPLSNYFIILYLLMSVVLFCYPHRSSFAGPMHKDTLLAYDNSVIISVGEGLFAVVCVIVSPVLIALLSASEVSFEHNLMHLICEEAIIFVLLSFSPCCELLKFANHSEDDNSWWGDKKTVERRLRVFGFCLSVVSVMSAFFLLDSSSDSLLLSQLLLSLVSIATLAYLFMSANTAITQKVSGIAVVFCTLVFLCQLFTVDTSDCERSIDADECPVQYIHQISLCMLTLLMMCALTAKTNNKHRSLVAVPLCALVFVWSNYAHFFVSSGVINDLLAQLITLTAIFLINALFRCAMNDDQKGSRDPSCSQWLSEPVYLFLISWLSSLSVHLMSLASASSPSANVFSMWKVALTAPSVAVFLAPSCLQDSFYALTGNNLDGNRKVIPVGGGIQASGAMVMTVVSLFVHVVFGGSGYIGGAFYTLLTGYAPSASAEMGISICLCSLSLLQIWCERLQHVRSEQRQLWLGLALVSLGCGILITLVEPDSMFSARLCLFIGLIIAIMVCILLITSVPTLTATGVKRTITALLFGIFVGSIIFTLLIGMQSRKFPIDDAGYVLAPHSLLIYSVYVLQCSLGSFLAVTLKNLWSSGNQVQRDNFVSASSVDAIFTFVSSTSVFLLIASTYLEMSMLGVSIDCYVPWLFSTPVGIYGGVPPSCLLFFGCFALNSIAIKLYQRQLASHDSAVMSQRRVLPQNVVRVEKVLSLLAIVLGLLVTPKKLLSIWVPGVLCLMYRPDVKPWLSKQSANSLSFVLITISYAVIGLLVALSENYLLFPSPNLVPTSQTSTVMHTPTLSSWQFFCGLTELFLLLASSLCHALVSLQLYAGVIEQEGYLHYILTCAPLGLILGIIGCSSSSTIYGISSTVLVIAATWSQLPFSQ